MTLKFYTAPGTIGIAIHIALEESGLSYEKIDLDFKAKEQMSDDYRRINPRQRVPCLVVDGQALAETPAILVYLAQVAGTSEMDLPEDPLAFAGIQSFNAYLASTVHVAHAHGPRGSRWTDDTQALAAMQAYVPTSMGQCFDLIEQELLKGPWVLGGEYSICDPYLFALSLWLEGDGVDIARFPKVQAHRQAMQEREAVQRVVGRS